MDINTKLCVYAICKNESKFIDRWVASLQGEADCVVVLDTGSTDDSVEKLKKYEPFVTVKQFDYFKELGYFRFDKARNDSLKMVPYDAGICVVLDLDQVPIPGWANAIRERFREGYSEVYGAIIDHDENGRELNQWTSRNVHPNSPFWIWNKVIHEGIQHYGDEEYKTVYDRRFTINHYPDTHKDRSLYKDLLYYSCKEYPKDPYYGIYLGIELSRRYSMEEATEAFRRALNECDYTGKEDIHFQTYLNLAVCTNDDDEALDALFDAKELSESLNFKSRRLYKSLADIYEKRGEIDKAIAALEEAVEKCPTYSSDWTDDASNYNGYIEDRLSLFYYYHKKNYLKAIEWSTKALSQNPSNQRLKTNLEYCVKAFMGKDVITNGK
jgi:tetratricopeptide (TPR) repeat protein